MSKTCIEDRSMSGGMFVCMWGCSFIFGGLYCISWRLAFSYDSSWGLGKRVSSFHRFASLRFPNAQEVGQPTTLTAAVWANFQNVRWVLVERDLQYWCPISKFYNWSKLLQLECLHRSLWCSPGGFLLMGSSVDSCVFVTIQVIFGPGLLSWRGTLLSPQSCWALLGRADEVRSWIEIGGLQQRRLLRKSLTNHVVLM